MDNRTAITDDVSISDQPTENELEQLAEEGFRSVINLRHDGEDQMPMTPRQEGQRVRALGMEYENIPVSIPRADAALVERFREKLAAMPKPVLVHCKLGARAGAFVVMDLAAREGLSGEQALAEGGDRGFVCDNQDLADFVKRYVDNCADDRN